MGWLGRLGGVLKGHPNRIRVEGYTDDRPIRTNVYPSNWELSTARAGSVVRLFVENGVASRPWWPSAAPKTARWPARPLYRRPRLQPPGDHQHPAGKRLAIMIWCRWPHSAAHRSERRSPNQRSDPG